MPIFAAAEVGNQETIFEARVLKILDQRTIKRDGGSENVQQDIRLRGLEGEFKDEEFIFFGVGNLDVINSSIYAPGDRVVVSYAKDTEGNDKFYIIDYVRRGYLGVLAFVFALLVAAIGGWKGIKSLISLLVTFVLIMNFVIPQILSGRSPVVVGIFGSFLILFFVIYITEGWSRRSHIAIFSISIMLLLTYVLSALFSDLTKLTGTAEEAIGSLIDTAYGVVDFRGLLLASILIGTLGVLDDIVLAQIESVAQIKEANPALSSGKVFMMASKIGNTHLGAVVNTLFLAYAGASLPLLLLFGIKQPPFATFGQVVNNESIATEIVRTLVGSACLTIAIPISTLLAVYFLKIEKRESPPSSSHN